MKKSILTFLALVTVSTVFAQVDSEAARQKAKEEAIAYNDVIVGEQVKIGTGMNNFVNAETDDAYDLNYKILLKQIDASINVVQKLGPWKGDAALQKSAIELFKFYKSISEKEYKEFLTILKKADEDITDADIEYMQKLEATITEREEKFDNDFAYNQTEFAKRWGFELEVIEDVEE